MQGMAMTKSSVSYLVDALERMGDMPDSKKAEQLKMSAQALWNYKNGVSKMDNFACIMVGRYLGIDPMAIIAACEEERAKNEEKQGFWRDFRSTLGSTIVAALVVTSLIAMMPTPAQAGTFDTAKEPMTNVYYVKCCAENQTLGRIT